MSDITLSTIAENLDTSDPLKQFRERFRLEEDLIYLDGNSLGPMMVNIPNRIARTMGEEWSKGLIKSWNDADWVNLPHTVGARIAPLIGAEKTSVIACDSTSINLFKVLSAALGLRPDRRKMISEKGNFPTDLYIAHGLGEMMGKGHQIVLTENDDGIVGEIDEDTAVLMLTQVDFRSGRMLDMKEITKAAHEKGALVIWDLAHSAGALPVALEDCDADFAIGCGYKYLNGGPGAPAFLYVNEKHHGKAVQPLTGWFSHEAPFEFDASYRPSNSIRQFLCGTQPTLSMVALDEALNIWDDVGIEALREKSMVMTQFFIQCMDTILEGYGFELISPRKPEQRGSQVSYRFNEGAYAIVQALIARNIIGDYRDPGIMRFGFAPLYLRYCDVLKTVETLKEIVDTQEWKNPEYNVRKAVT